MGITCQIRRRKRCLGWQSRIYRNNIKNPSHRIQETKFLTLMVTVRRISNSIQSTDKGWMSFSSANHNEVAKAFINLLNQISQQPSCSLIQVTLSEQFSDEPPPANGGKANQDHRRYQSTNQHGKSRPIKYWQLKIQVQSSKHHQSY